MKPIIIYAEIGAGKTTHAKVLTELFGARGWVDDWCNGKTIPDGYIALTSTPTASAIDCTYFLYQARAIKRGMSFDFSAWASSKLFNVSDSPPAPSLVEGQGQEPNPEASVAQLGQRVQDLKQNYEETQPFSERLTYRPQPKPAPCHEALVEQYLTLLNQAYNLLVK